MDAAGARQLSRGRSSGGSSGGMCQQGLSRQGSHGKGLGMGAKGVKGTSPTAMGPSEPWYLDPPALLHSAFR